MDLSSILSELLSSASSLYSTAAAVTDFISTLLGDIDYSSLLSIISNLISSLV